MRELAVLGKDARIHEKTLKNIPQSPIVRESRKNYERSKLTAINVDRRVWKQALLLANGDWRRLKILGETEVVVANRRVR